MSNTVYVLGVIAWIIYSFYKAGKKLTDGKKTTSGKTTAPRESNDEKEFGGILEEILSKKAPAPKPVTINVPTKKKVFKEKSFEPSVRNINAARKKTEQSVFFGEAIAEQYNREHTVHHPILNEIKAFEEEKKSPWIEEFDMAKAIVYAEILKRPTY